MAKYANQFHSTIKKAPCDKDNLYTMINIDALFKAMKALNGTEFKLWIYLSKNQNDFGFDFSPQHLQDVTGVSKASSWRAVNKLTELGFILYKHETPEDTTFTFYEVPQAKIEKRIIKEEINQITEKKISSEELHTKDNNRLNEKETIKLETDKNTKVETKEIKETKEIEEVAEPVEETVVEIEKSEATAPHELTKEDIIAEKTEARELQFGRKLTYSEKYLINLQATVAVAETSEEYSRAKRALQDYLMA